MELTFLASMGHVFKFATTDLENALYAAFPASALFNMKVPFILMLLLRYDLTPVFQDIQECYNQTSSIFFEKADELSQKITKYFVIYFVLYYGISTFVSSAVPVMSLYIREGGVSPENLIVPYQFVLPWNQDTVELWFLTTIFGIVTAMNYFFVNSSILSFFIGITLYFRAFYQNFVTQIEEIDRSNKIQSTNLLGKAVEYHNFVKK